MFNRSAKRLGFASAGIIMALALFSASAQAKLPQPIYFWSNIPEPVSGGFIPNPLVVRPSTFLLFEDGQWFLQDMHWTGWGSSVAHATGISNSSNDIPNAEQGKRIKTWARVTLSDPGWFQGHEVYRCFDLAVPPPATLGPHPWCLLHSGSLWGLMEGAPTPRPAPPKSLQVLEFNAGAPLGGTRLGGVECEIDDDPSVNLVEVNCQSMSFVSMTSTTPNHIETATLAANGRVQLCAGQNGSDRCDIGNEGLNIPTFKVGRRVTVGPFRCQVLDTGVKCTVTKSGKGFLINRTRAIRIG
jgi:hypothetical protein